MVKEVKSNKIRAGPCTVDANFSAYNNVLCAEEVYNF
jgi:hypothetical protein